MSWVVTDKKEIDNDTLRHLNSEIRKDRQFWYDKSLAYLNWYTSFALALLSAFFLLLTKKDDLGNYMVLLTILPVIAAVLCYYARKSILICYRQFLEHTTIMAKLEYILGLYRTTEGSSDTAPFFSEDKFLNPQRHYDYLQKFGRSEQFVAAELGASQRTYRYKLRIFALLQAFAIILAIIIFTTGLLRIADGHIPKISSGAKVQSVPGEQLQKAPPSDKK